MSLYNLRSSGYSDPDKFAITKFDEDMNPLNTYDVSLNECTCPAGVRPTCRHRTMLPHFLATNRFDNDWFYDFESGKWEQPFEPLDEPASAASDTDNQAPGHTDLMISPEAIEEALASATAPETVIEQPSLALAPAKPWRRV